MQDIKNMKSGNLQEIPVMPLFFMLDSGGQNPVKGCTTDEI